MQDIRSTQKVNCVSIYWQQTSGNQKKECNRTYSCFKENEIVINLTKHVQDHYAENYKMLIKEIKENLNLQGAILCSWIGTFNMKTSTPLTWFIGLMQLKPKSKQGFPGKVA